MTCRWVEATGDHEYMSLAIQESPLSPGKRALGCYHCDLRIEDPEGDPMWVWITLLEGRLAEILEQLPKHKGAKGKAVRITMSRKIVSHFREHGWRPPD